MKCIYYAHDHALGVVQLELDGSDISSPLWQITVKLLHLSYSTQS